MFIAMTRILWDVEHNAFNFDYNLSDKEITGFWKVCEFNHRKTEIKSNRGNTDNPIYRAMHAQRSRVEIENENNKFRMKITKNVSKNKKKLIVPKSRVLAFKRESESVLELEQKKNQRRKLFKLISHPKKK